MASLRLTGSLRIPAIGLGTSTVPKNENGIKIFESAIDVGYRHIDTGSCYQNEKLIGQAIKNKLKEGIVKREDLFVTTKVSPFLHRREEVMQSMKTSLTDLQLDYVDLYLVHTPITNEKCDNYQNVVFIGFYPATETGFKTDNVDSRETWRGMEDVYNSGLAKSIGLSNYNSKQVQRVYDAATIKPVNLQVECHPHFQQKQLHHFCENLGIVLSAYAPLGSPHVTDGRAGWSVQSDEGRKIALEDPVLEKLAKKYKKGAAQVSLRWLYQRGISTLPKSSNIERLKANMDVFDFELSEADMEEIAAIPVNYRIFRETIFENDPNYPFMDPF